MLILALQEYRKKYGKIYSANELFLITGFHADLINKFKKYFTMKKIITIALFFAVSSVFFAQMESAAYFNRGLQDQSDSTRPWLDGGVREAYFAGDMDGDGNMELVATDYSNSGRVHVL